jgi:hypothetical protein
MAIRFLTAVTAVAISVLLTSNSGSRERNLLTNKE